jgi:PRD1 phage membrane DNA delivery
MSDQLITSVTTVLTAIIGVAIIATLVSKNANTSQVLQSGGQAFSQSLGTALSPVTGSSFTGGGASLSMPSL